MNFQTQQAICQHCNRKWIAVFECDTESLECPECHGCTAVSEMAQLLNPPLHLVISRYEDGTYMKISRECDRIYLAGLLSEALHMVNASSVSIVKPEDCQLRVILSVEKPEVPHD